MKNTYCKTGEEITVNLCLQCIFYESGALIILYDDLSNQFAVFN
jgi:hypothetical protein